MPRKPLGAKPIPLSTSFTLTPESIQRLDQLCDALHSKRSGVVRLAIERLHESEVVGRKRERNSQEKPGKRG